MTTHINHRPSLIPHTYSHPNKHTHAPKKKQVVSESIKYVPHYRTLTDAGKAHFSEVAYAVADLVDNSIQVEYSIDIVCVKGIGEACGCCA